MIQNYVFDVIIKNHFVGIQIVIKIECADIYKIITDNISFWEDECRMFLIEYTSQEDIIKEISDAKRQMTEISERFSRLEGFNEENILMIFSGH